MKQGQTVAINGNRGVSNELKLKSKLRMKSWPKSSFRFFRDVMKTVNELFSQSNNYTHDKFSLKGQTFKKKKKKKVW